MSTALGRGFCKMYTSSQGGTVIGFGAAALDHFAPHGEVGADFVAGGKIGWSPETDELLRQLRQDGCEKHVGGNVLNVLAYLATRQEQEERKTYEKVGFVTLMGGADCEISSEIVAHVERLDIDSSHITPVEGYNPSVSIVERLNGRRMVRGRPRDPMDDHMDDGLIESAATEAGLVVVSSIKSEGLTRRIFDRVPHQTPLSYNPGSSEFRDYPHRLTELMEDRHPSLLALNETEIAQLFGVSEAQDLKTLGKLAQDATRLAQFVLCTAGEDGIILAENGDSTHRRYPARVIENPQDTLGAGDRAHAVAIHNLLPYLSAQRQLPEDTAWRILHDIAADSAQVVQHTGAHGDLYQTAA